MALADEINKRWPAIQQVSTAVFQHLGPRFTNTATGHIQTDIAAAGSLAGLMILQEAVPKSKLTELSESGTATTTFVLSDCHRNKDDTYHFMAGTASGFGLDPRAVWSDEIPREHNPLMECRDMTKRLAPAFYAACKDASLEREYYKFAAAYTGVRLVVAGFDTGILDPRIGKALLSHYVEVGRGTIPYAEALWE